MGVTEFALLVETEKHNNSANNDEKKQKKNRRLVLCNPKIYALQDCNGLIIQLTAWEYKNDGFNEAKPIL